MTIADTAREALELMLSKLGIKFGIEVTEDEHGPTLQIRTAEPNALIGRGGERLEEMQHMVNKLVLQKFPRAPKIRVDVENYRDKREEQFLNEIRALGDKVRQTGHPEKLEPLNSYQRRLVHGLFKDDPEVQTWSPEDTSRLKRITLLPRKAAPPAPRT